MEKYKCDLCGMIIDGPITSDTSCPLCDATSDHLKEYKEVAVSEHDFKIEKEERVFKKEAMDGKAKWRCGKCGLVYEGVLSEDFTCPLCGAGVENFNLDDALANPTNEIKRLFDETGKVLYRCTVCGYVHEGAMSEDFVCPSCGTSNLSFERISAAPEIIEDNVVKKYKCNVCGHIHEGKITKDFICPLCDSKESYSEYQEDDLASMVTKEK